jgi:DNA repair protein RadC
VIDEALHILDRRLFSRGPNLTSPDAVAAYLKLQLAQQEHEVFGVIFSMLSTGCWRSKFCFTAALMAPAFIPDRSLSALWRITRALPFLFTTTPQGVRNPARRIAF